MSEQHDPVPHIDAAPTDGSVHSEPELHTEGSAAIAAAPAADAPPPAPGGDAPKADPPPPAKKPLEQWAREKGVHPFVTKAFKSRRTGKPKTKLVPNRNNDKHFYAGALAKWGWVPTMEVTEQEFDTELLRVKHGVVIGAWPHPKGLAEQLLEQLARGEHKMGAIPDVVTTIVDNALGTTPPSSATSAAVIGSCALGGGGAVNTVYGFNDPDTMLAMFPGGGPAVELAAYMLKRPGHGTVYLVPCTCSTAGACGSTTYTRIGTPSIGTIVASGAAYDAYSFIITIVTGETVVASGGGTFTYSQDGGNTTSPVIAIPTGGTYAVPDTNVTLTFTGASNAFNAGDVATIVCTAPYYSGADFTTAFNALVANGATWRFVAAVGAAASATAAATFASTLQSLMSGLEATNDAFAYGAMQCNDTDANCKTAFASFAGNRVAVCAGQAEIVSNVSGDTYTRDAMWAAFARIATRPISEDAGRVATGSLDGVSSLLRNEQSTPGLDAARFITLRTITGKQGFYITSGWTMAASGSDFQLLQNRQVMDVACTAARAAELDFLNDTLRVNPDDVAAPLVPGAINPIDADNIETEVKSGISDALKIGATNGKTNAGDASACSVVVNQSTDILETEDIPVTVRVTPNGYGKSISNNIGLQNPAFQG